MKTVPTGFSSLPPSGPAMPLIATAIVALAKALDKRVVAEGVETIAQADILEGLGVDELQGYLFGKPQSAAEMASAHWPRGGKRGATP